MKPGSIRLFIKPGCPWCDDAVDWLEGRGIQYETLDVTRNGAAQRELLELTGRNLAPSIDVDGQVLADFGADELEEWWREQGFEA